jgi:FkbM family methyltransferase
MYSNGYDSIANQVYWGGIEAYETNTMVIFKLLVKNSRVFFDIGANTGIYSLYSASVNKELDIHSFEPINTIYEYLEKNKRINGFENLHINNLALSNKEGNLTFYIPFDDMMHVPLGASSRSEHLTELKRIMNEVKATTLDKYIQQNGIDNIDIIKIDTEGTEHMVFEGGFNILSKSKPAIFCEVLSGVNESKVQPLLDKLNYKYLVLTEKGLKIEKEITGSKSRDYINHLFVQDRHIDILSKNSVPIFN